MSTQATDAPADILAVGLGPFNLGLAALAAPLGVDLRVLEAQDEFTWHPGMLIEGATIQVPFLADLVTMADPTSEFSFLNYLKATGRLYSFYIRESFYPLRAEYQKYCSWVAERLAVMLRFGQRVTSVTYDAGTELYEARTQVSGTEVVHRGRKLVIGVGTEPYIPEALHGLGSNVIHSADYLPHRDQLWENRKVSVVGSGQSAAEIFHDLLQAMPSGDHHLDWVTRSERFFPMEYTKLTLEMTSPDYIDHFHSLPGERRSEIVRGQRQLYKGISEDLINDIFDSLYRLSVDGPVRARLGTGEEVTAASQGPDGVRLALRHLDQGAESAICTDLVIAATGYRSRAPQLLASLPSVQWEESGLPQVNRDYSLAGTDGGVFVQNAEEHTHFLTAPDLGMGPYRNSVILNTILGKEVYRAEESIAFQTFGALND